jgi:hypothetical protein
MEKKPTAASMTSSSLTQDESNPVKKVKTEPILSSPPPSPSRSFMAAMMEQEDEFKVKKEKIKSDDMDEVALPTKEETKDVVQMDLERAEAAVPIKKAHAIMMKMMMERQKGELDALNTMVAAVEADAEESKSNVTMMAALAKLAKRSIMGENGRNLRYSGGIPIPVPLSVPKKKPALQL